MTVRPPARLAAALGAGVALLSALVCDRVGTVGGAGAPLARSARSAPAPGGLPSLETELSVVSYNVHGLPGWITFDDTEDRLERIGRLLAVYDVALVQEDWWYPERLRHAARARLDLRAARAGLSLLTSLPREHLVEEAARAFGRCAGWLLGANDCFADKGAHRARLRLETGAEVDLWNTHFDAGAGDDDQATRLAQLDALAGRVERESAGRAVVLAGDLNLDFDRPDHRAAVDAFRTRLGLADSGARPVSATPGAGHGGRIDWLLHRGGAGVALAPIDAGEAREFTHEGRALSDHPALYAKFRVQRE
jgi:endonuclease/exonuclease/phosphatase family metal-dependent hydrolase